MANGQTPNPLVDPVAMQAMIQGLAQQSQPQGLPAPQAPPMGMDPLMLLQMLQGGVTSPGGMAAAPPVAAAPVPVPGPTFTGTPPGSILEAIRQERERREEEERNRPPPTGPGRGGGGEGRGGGVL